MRNDTFFGLLATACIVAIFCPSPGLAVDPGPVTAAEIESSFRQLSSLRQGVELDEALVGLGKRARAGKAFPARRAPLDLENVDYIELVRDELGLSQQHLAQLSRDGVILRRTQSDFSFPAAYYSIFVRDLPLLVTTDSILHAVHRSFDTILDETESRMIRPVLAKMLDRAHAEVGELEDHEAGPRLQQSLEDVDLYLSVARNLLAGRPTRRNGIFEPMVVEKEKVEQILQRIRNAGAVEETEIYGTRRKIDYTQFTPRGRYTGYGKQNYFHAMTWLGRADCGWRVDVRDEASDRELRNAVLICHLLQRGSGVETLARIDRFFSEFIGQANGLSAINLVELMARGEIATLDDCIDPSKLRWLEGELNSEDRSRRLVRSEVVDPESTQPRIRFQVFSQRFAIDAFILGQVTFDAIDFGGQQPKRMLPKGLDVMASLGNSLAVDLLRPELQRWKYWNQLGAARALVEGLDASYWDRSFYNSWLHSIAFLSRGFEDDEAVPSALQTRSWQLKQLQTQLASWAELRRDTMLYVAQTYSPPGCEYPTAYVEPYPQFYASLRRLMRRTAAFQREFAAEGQEENYRGFAEAIERQQAFLETASGHLETLEKIARKELKGDPLSKQDEEFLQRTINRGGNTLFGSAAVMGVGFDGWYTKLIYGFKGDGWSGKIQDKFHPVIADVHSSPGDNTVLQVGTGRTDLCVLIADQSDDCGCVYVGPAYSYYEFAQPMQERITGRQWKTELDDARVEQKRPAWIDSLLVEGVAPDKPLGQTAVSRDGDTWTVWTPGGRWGGTHSTKRINVTDEGLKDLVKLAPTTLWLDLSKSPVTDQGLAELQNLDDLRALSLQDTSATDTAVQRLAGFKYLRVLNLNDTQIGGAAIETIARWNYLGHLELANTEVGDSDVRKLRNLHYLRHLDLRGTRVTREAIEEIVASRPQMEVLWDKP